MSALATIMQDCGHVVTGSDVEKQFFTDEKLKEKNIKVGKFTDQIESDVDLVILGNAFKDDHDQVLQAKELGIPVKRYYAYLNEFANTHKHSIAIAGTNGKTTTTSMSVSMLRDKQPSYLIGDGNGFGNSDSDTFIFEACEYKNTFYNYHPEYAIINNVEMDHPDFFKDLDDVINTFQNFANNANNVIVNMDDKPSLKLVENGNKFHYFSINNSEANLYMKNIDKSAEGFAFELIYNQESLGNFTLPFYGDHMIQNTLSSLLVGLLIGEKIEDLIAGLSTFGGAKRRFEKYLLDEARDNWMIDDYAHHPTAIELTIDAVRQQYPDHQLTVIFQPHTYSRTIEFLDGFANTLVAADNVMLLPIFGSIREAKGEITIDVLKDKVKEINAEKLIEDLDVIDINNSKQIICLLGAGDIDKKYIPILKNKFGV